MGALVQGTLPDLAVVQTQGVGQFVAHDSHQVSWLEGPRGNHGDPRSEGGEAAKWRAAGLRQHLAGEAQEGPMGKGPAEPRQERLGCPTRDGPRFHAQGVGLKGEKGLAERSRGNGSIQEEADDAVLLAGGWEQPDQGFSPPLWD